MKVKGKNTKTKDVLHVNRELALGNVCNLKGSTLPSNFPHQYNQSAFPCNDFELTMTNRVFIVTKRRLYLTCPFSPH